MPAVKVENVSVTYRTTFERTPTFKQAIVRFGRGERAVREVHALKNVSFTNATFNVHVDRKTYEPKSFGLEMTTVVASASGRKFTTLHSFDGKYYNVNKVESQKMPSRVDEVLK